MSVFDCGRCGARFPDEPHLVKHRSEVHGGMDRAEPSGVPLSAPEKPLNGHTRAEEIRRKSHR